MSCPLCEVVAHGVRLNSLNACSLIYVMELSLGIVLTAGLISVACGVESDRIVGPQSWESQPTPVTFRATVWSIQDTGLAYITSRRGTTKRALSGDLSADTGVAAPLAPNEIQRASELLFADLTVSAILNSQTFLATARSVGGPLAQRRPALNNGRTVNLGTLAGERYEMQIANRSKSPNAPRVKILMINGKARSIEVMVWKRVAGRVRPERMTTITLDSTGTRRYIYNVEFDANRSSASVRKILNRLDLAGDAFIRLVQPDALRAATVDEFEEWPCWTEAGKSLLASSAAAAAQGVAAAAESAAIVAAGAAAVAQAAAVDALALCSLGAIPACEAAAAAQAAALVAAASAAALQAASAGAFAAAAGLTVFAGMKALELADCMERARIRADSIAQADSGIYTTTSSGSGGGEGNNCETISWWISFDNGVTWAWDGDEQVCQWAT